MKRHHKVKIRIVTLCKRFHIRPKYCTTEEDGQIVLDRNVVTFVTIKDEHRGLSKSKCMDKSIHYNTIYLMAS